MTKFELTERLAELLGIERHVTLNNKNMNKFFFKPNALEVEEFNPCENWNDIMPIAIELGVTLINDKTCSEATTDAYEHYEPHGLNENDGYFAVPVEGKGKEIIAVVKCCIAVLESKANK